MIGIDKYCKNIALSVVAAGALAGFAPALYAHNYSHDTVRSAQDQLKDKGYYKGNVDGIDGPMTQAAIRHFQKEKNLTVNGKLDRETRDELGVKSTGEASRTGEANRSADESQTAAPSSAAVSAAQRKLHEKGFYKGDVTGKMDAETHAAIREYQRNSNLNVNGRLDQETLSNLGVSK